MKNLMRRLDIRRKEYEEEGNSIEEEKLCVEEAER